MKTIKHTRTLSSIFSFILLFSCESHETQADKLVRKYKLENEASSKNKSNKEISLALKKIDNVKNPIENKIIFQSEWTHYKTEIEKRIRLNEIKIAEIKRKPTNSAKYFKKVSNLERSNLELRNQLKKFEEEIKIKSESFQQELNSDLTEIESELVNLYSDKSF
jgi:hypothetical protein